MARSDDWRRHAKCSGMNADVFYPNPKDKAGRDWAKRICRSCPVIDQCLEQALRDGEQYGIWGGLEPEERRTLMRRRRRRERMEWEWRRTI